MRVLKKIKEAPGFFKIWNRYILEYLKQDESDLKILRNYNMYSDGNSLMSGRDNILVAYTFDGLPSSVPVNFYERFRVEAGAGVKIGFINVMEASPTEWQSSKVKATKNVWKANIEESKEVDAFNYVDEFVGADENSWRVKTLYYLPEAEVKRGRKALRTRVMMVVAGKRGLEFDKTIENVKGVASNLGITLNRVGRDMRKYLRAYSPFSLTGFNKISSQVGKVVMTDELIARFNSFTQGKVGTKGVYMGVDLYSGYPVFKQFKKRTTDAEINLVSAQTGGGKSYKVKGALYQHAGNPKTRITVLDIEGYEYLYLLAHLAKNEKVVLLNLSEGSGRYFDPVEIALTGDAFIDGNSFSLSRSFTESIFRILIGQDIVEEHEWIDDIISDALSNVYLEAGVGAEMSTWGNSKGLTLKDVYLQIKDTYLRLQDGEIPTTGLAKYLDNDNFLNSYDLVIAKLRKYFEEFEDGGTQNQFFQKRVSLDEVKDAKMVVCSFGMAGRSSETISETSMALTMLYSSFISQIRSLFCFVDGKYNVKVYEEFQRFSKFQGSLKVVGESVTGGRKLGDIVYIVTNALRELLEQNTFGILENVTSFEIGLIGDEETRQLLADKLSLGSLKSELDLIAKKSGDNKSFGEDYGDTGFKSKYDKAFLVYLDRSVATTVRLSLPNSLSQSPIFKTNNEVDLEAVQIAFEQGKTEDDIEEL